MDIEKKCVTNTNVTHFFNKKKKDFQTGIRINKEEWIRFKEIAKSYGISANDLINKIIFSFVNGLSSIKISEGNFYVNVNLVQPIQQSLTQIINKKEKISITDFIIEKEVTKWIEIAERQKREGYIYPKIRAKIFNLMAKIKEPRKELVERVKKLWD